MLFLVKYFKRIVPSCQVYYSIMVLTSCNIIQFNLIIEWYHIMLNEVT